jgi:teichuronic acid biosynthesis glycosyltransferase TuaH
MSKIFYLMHVPWGWIKQRPHFLAEELNQNFDVDVYVPKTFRNKILTKNNTRINIINLFKLPFERFLLVRKINLILTRFLIKYFYNLSEYKFIWITDIRLYPQIKGIIGKGQKLIYDCMDDVLEFEVLKNQNNELKKIEKELFLKADIVFFSSNELKRRKSSEYNLDNFKTKIVFNALDSNFLNNKIYDKFDESFKKYHAQGYKILTYIGTISNWFDFEIIEKSLEDFEKIIYFIIGPIEHNVKVMKHERIIYFGSVEHKYIKSLIFKSDILIMPFKINKLIEAVDPVKLYEYIALKKNIIAVEYPELKKFTKFINKYNNYGEYQEIIRNIDKISFNKSIQDSFIEKNSWQDRSQEIISQMDIFNE